MDMFNLWNDDPVEALLDLGFGCDEPDLSGRIPIRFLRCQSQARGITLQLFLDAQKNRVDFENPDISNRFRQIEVLQQVTTAFSLLVGSGSSHLKVSPRNMSPDAQEKRRRMGMLFRQASKKSLSQIHRNKSLGVAAPAANLLNPESQQLPSSLIDTQVQLKRDNPGPLETVRLSTLDKEQGDCSGPLPYPHLVSLTALEGAVSHVTPKDAYPLEASHFLQKKKTPGQARELLEMEEVGRAHLTSNSFMLNNVHIIPFNIIPL
ncbi:protein ITPRID1 [Kryptolebias marmoratus]|uniref:protein ITPRID1 n=1 Tax=Kryptolebias marmoratus TaxID=37003 RepID=UPI0018ACC34A|nr:protein ITPRID1 [Kryptolebias marmoratus]